MDNSITQNKKIINKTIILLGDSKVGKTSFIRRYAENTFKENYYETLGCDYHNKKIKNKNEIFSLQIWDTNGYEYDRQFLSQQVYKVCSLFVIMCSLDNYESYNNLEKWFDFLNNISRNLNKGSSFLLPVVLLINKNDLKNEKKFNFSDVWYKVQNLKLKIWISYFSTKDNNYKDILEKIDDLIKDNSNQINLSIEKLNNLTSSSDNFNETNNTKKNKKSNLSFKIQPSDRDKSCNSSCCKK